MIGTIQRVINRLLPFATPGTPLIQDVLHLCILCIALYFAPQIQAWYQAKSRGHNNAAEQENQTPEEQQSLLQNDAQAQPPAQQQVPPAVAVEDEDEEDDDDAEDNDGPLFPGAGPEAEINEGAEDGAAGPAGPRPTSSSSRTVGAKKAKSLARKDQRRAYHEFMRSQGEAQRAQEAEGAKEREAVLAEERARRAAAEAEVEARRVKEREEKRERELKAQKEEMARRESAVALVRQGVQESGMCDMAAIAKEIGSGADRTWVENLVKASGLLNERHSTEAVTMLTETGWVVRVSKEDMQAAFTAVLDTGSQDDQGRVSNGDFGNLLEGILRNRVQSSS